MSFVPGSEPRDLWLVLGGTAALVGSLQWWTRRELGQPGRLVSRCADGSVIGAWGFGVRRRPPRRHGLRLGWRAGFWRPGADAGARVREDLEPGDLSFIRIREGGADEPGWLVEGLDPGPEPFRIRWVFETPDLAFAAFQLIEQRIARPPQDADGQAVILGDREFDALWRRDEGGGLPASESTHPLRGSA